MEQCTVHPVDRKTSMAQFEENALNYTIKLNTSGSQNKLENPDGSGLRQ
jgi:hypothetical protein